MPKFTSYRQIFGIDTRSLALFRVSISVMLIIDLLVRLSDLTAHYTDWGVLPRSVSIENTLGSPWSFSLHLMNGSLQGQVLLFTIQLIFAFLLLIGYRTRIATAVSWVFLTSLHSSNIMVLSGADDTFRLILFWAVFLPLGARFSIDRALNSRVEPTPDEHLSMGSMALMVQVSIIYLFTFLFKMHPVWLNEYSALYYMFNLDNFSNDFARSFLQFPELLKAMTAVFVWMELTVAIIVWSPVFTTHARLFTIFIVTTMHIGIATTMGIGIFPFVSIVSIWIFLPGATWDWIFARLQTPSRTGVRIYFDGGCDFCRKIIAILCTFCLIPSTRAAPATEKKEMKEILESKNSWVVVDHNNVSHIRFDALTHVMRKSPIFFPMGWIMQIPPAPFIGDKLYQAVASRRTELSGLFRIFPWRPLYFHIPKWQQVLVGLVLVFVIMYNVSVYDRFNWNPLRNNELADQIQSFASIGLYQNWSLFAPYPATDDGWYVIPGVLTNGQTVDLWRDGAPVSWEKPPEVRHDYKNNRWVKYMRNLWMADYAYLRLHFGRYLCRNWNAKHHDQDVLRTFSIVFMMEQTLPNYEKSKVERVDIWNHDCFAKGPS